MPRVPYREIAESTLRLIYIEEKGRESRNKNRMKNCRIYTYKNRRLIRIGSIRQTITVRAYRFPPPRPSMGSAE